uniref:Uncharacterized protein n=1 Tax=Sphaerodactylus townsendi TaxID=933632 RepID=A0ACB8EKX7_9SAUR
MQPDQGDQKHMPQGALQRGSDQGQGHTVRWLSIMCLEDTDMKTAATHDEKGMHWSGREQPRSCREKFLQAWDEKVKHQHSAILSAQELVHQPAVGIPTEGNGTRGRPLSHWQRGTILQPSKSAIYVLAVMTVPQGQHYSSPLSLLAPKFPTSHSIRQLDLLDNKLARSSLDWEHEGELLHICVSDLLLGSPVRKRPRLLPPNRKMHVEVWKKPASHSLQEGERSPVPLEYSHLVDTMAVNKPADLPEVESFYRSFAPRRRQQGCHRRIRPVHPLGEYPSSTCGMEPVTYQQRAPKRSYKEHLLYCPKTNVPFSSFTMATKESMNTSENGHLPPKKRYTQSCL